MSPPSDLIPIINRFHETEILNNNTYPLYTRILYFVYGFLKFTYMVLAENEWGQLAALKTGGIGAVRKLLRCGKGKRREGKNFRAKCVENRELRPPSESRQIAEFRIKVSRLRVAKLAEEGKTRGKRVFGCSQPTSFIRTFLISFGFGRTMRLAGKEGWFSLGRARGMMDRKHSSVRFFKRCKISIKGCTFALHLLLRLFLSLFGLKFKDESY